MKVLLYFESEELIQTSGIGRAFKHQQKALELAGVEYTIDPWSDDYDILHINTYGFNSDAIIKKTRNMGKKVIYHAHSTEEDFKNSFVLSNQIAPIFKKHIVSLYSKADAIITPTSYSKSILQSYGIDLPIYDVSNGIDLSRFKYDEEKIKAYRKYFSLSKDDKVILSVGLFFERKGLLDFIEIAKRLPEYKFIWFGNTPLISVPKNIRDALEDIPNNLILPGYVKGPIIEGAYLDADCFFFPSYEETEGIVVLEALASGQQVLVRDIGVFNPWLKSGENCYKGNSNEEFISLIHDIVNKKIPHTGLNGINTANERSIENVGESLKSIYLKVLNEKE